MIAIWNLRNSNELELVSTHFLPGFSRQTVCFLQSSAKVVAVQRLEKNLSQNLHSPFISSIFVSSLYHVRPFPFSVSPFQFPLEFFEFYVATPTSRPLLPAIALLWLPIPTLLLRARVRCQSFDDNPGRASENSAGKGGSLLRPCGSSRSGARIDYKRQSPKEFQRFRDPRCCDSAGTQSPCSAGTVRVRNCCRRHRRPADRIVPRSSRSGSSRPWNHSFCRATRGHSLRSSFSHAEQRFAGT